LGLLIIWLSSFYIERKVERDRQNLLKNITFRKNGLDTINSGRMIYILAVYPVIIFFLSLLIYFLTWSLAYSFGFSIALPIYLLFSLKLNDQLQKNLKSIRFYFLSPEMHEILLNKRKTLQTTIIELFH
jgi:hypothetical protein